MADRRIETEKEVVRRERELAIWTVREQAGRLTRRSAQGQGLPQTERVAAKQDSAVNPSASQSPEG